MHGFSDHAGSNDGSRKRRHRYRLPPLSTASAPQTSPFSRLNSRPACTPVNASLHPHGTPTHDSGPPRIANPFDAETIHLHLRAGLTRRFPKASVVLSALSEHSIEPLRRPGAR